jgi:hypothetical protein
VFGGRGELGPLLRGATGVPLERLGEPADEGAWGLRVGVKAGNVGGLGQAPDAGLPADPTGIVV